MTRILIFCLIGMQLLMGQSYFIRLTDEGQGHKAELIRGNFNTLNTLARGIRPGNIKFHDLLLTHNNRSPFEKWLLVQKADKAFLQALQQAKWADLIEPVGVLKTSVLSDDSLSAEQWYLEKINSAGAWEVSRGSNDVVVGVIDTGVDYDHPDLQGRFWINSAEDLNGNGRLDSADENGLDDDGNGFIDDVIGYDFTDAPRFPDGGDYITPDNRPDDEFSGGHGTEVAGLIAAAADNGIGISGVAPGVRLMVLRAGTASGYLEEDDVAQALFYALNNGARIVNMSFGDVALSRFLRDVIRYVAGQGLILIASAGNSATDQIHFPSGLPDVISVGASDRNDGLAGFSNYGSSIDLVAPGVDMISTAPGGGYKSLNGTSFSAPLVSGVAALLLSARPQYSPQTLRNVLISTSDDIIFNGWDVYSGSGRLNAARALLLPYGGRMRIDEPLVNSAVSASEVQIRATVQHPDLESFSLDYGLGVSPQNWQSLGSISGRQVWQDSIATLRLSSLPDTLIELRLTALLRTGRTLEIHSTFEKDQTPPVISDIEQIPLLDGTQSAVLITFGTDDISVGRLMLINRDTGDTTIVNANYQSRRHRIKIDRETFDGRYDFRVGAVNLAGLTRWAGWRTKDRFELTDRFDWRGFEAVTWSLPPGYMLPHATDLDHDGKPEVIMSLYDEEQSFGPLNIYEFESGHFELRLETAFRVIPRDAGDVDGDGLSDMLLGFGQQTFLFEAVTENGFPTELVWQDTAAFWGAQYADTDGDGRGEIIGRQGDEGYRILESDGDNGFRESAFLGNPTRGANRLGVPRVQLWDMDGDGVRELAYGDYDGDVLVYRNTGNDSWELADTLRTRFENSTEMITAVDSLLILATHTTENVNYEHEFDARYWSMETFAYNRQDGLHALDTISFFGFSDTRDFDSAIRGFPYRGRPTLFAALFPHLYVLERRGAQWIPVWLKDNVRSNTVLFMDLSGDTRPEFYVNDGITISGYHAGSEQRPPAPLFLTVTVRDSQSIRLNWQSGAADYYKVYRKKEAGDWLAVDSVSARVYVDSALNRDSLYIYALTAVNSDFSLSESFFSNTDSVRLFAMLAVSGIQAVDAHSVRVFFDKDLDITRSVGFRAYLNQDSIAASSVVPAGGRNSLLISFDRPLQEGRDYQLILQNIFSADGMPLSRAGERLWFRYDAAPGRPIVRDSRLRENRLDIRFSQPMKREMLTDARYYEVIPSGSIKNIALLDSIGYSVRLTLDDQTLLGATGRASYVRLGELQSLSGRTLDDGTVVSLFRAVSGMRDTRVYPQPDRADEPYLYFAPLPAGEASLTVMNMNGALIRRVKAQTELGGLRWDKRDRNGQKVASGIYIYILETSAGRKAGKLVIVR